MCKIVRRSFLAVIATAAAIAISAGFGSGAAETPPSGRRVALSGYDPVAYFTLGRPQKGNDAFWFAFDDVIYHFMNAEHRAMFATNPERYAPQYAGFCAAAMSRGEKHEPDPEAWAIVNGKLYVVALEERIEQFKQDPGSFIGKANANWPRLRDAPPKN
jgi:YHS domain-containing protein